MRLTRAAGARAGCVLMAAVAAGSIPVAGFAGTADAATRARARAAGFAVQVIVPAGSTTVRGAIEIGSGTRSAKGAWSYADTPGLVAADSYAVSARARSAPRASTTTVLGGVSALGGLVRARSVTLEATASAPGGVVTDGLGVSIRGLRVAGSAVPVTANRIVAIPDVGTLTVDEQVESRSATVRRGFVTALHVRLTYAYRGLPAGTEVLIGFADAGVEVAAAPAAGAKAVTNSVLSSSAGQAAATSPPATGGTAAAQASQTAEAAANAKASAAPTGGHVSIVDAESPPPSGFSHEPPVSAVDRARLLASGAYRFPVVGGAAFTDDFGAPRSDTGFHQGIDFFAPVGTPIVAVHAGTLFNVGWNRLGGNRLWLDDGSGDAFYYAHLSAYAPTAVEGAKVEAGDVIGFAGATGDAAGTPSHLHFEIHPGGHWAIPPFDYVTGWRAQGATLAPADASSSPLALTAAGATAFAASPLEAAPGSTDIAGVSGLDLAGVAAIGAAPSTDEGSTRPSQGPPSPLGAPSASSGLGFGSLG